MNPVLDLPLKITAVIVGALLGIWLASFLVNRLSRSILAGADRVADRHRSSTESAEAAKVRTANAARRKQRAKTTSAVLKSAASLIIATIAILIILDLVGVNIGPILASAGIVGLAVGFGAQSLVKDIISGIFMLIEDQYGVGDVVDLGIASGTVEEVGLRVTRLRDIDGVRWYVRNGEILRVGNKTQDWSRARVKVLVSSDENIDVVSEKLRAIADEVAQELPEDIYDPPEIIAFDDLTANAVTIWVQVRTLPARQWQVARDLRREIQEAANAGEFTLTMPPILGT